MVLSWRGSVVQATFFFTVIVRSIDGQPVKGNTPTQWRASSKYLIFSDTGGEDGVRGVKGRSGMKIPQKDARCSYRRAKSGNSICGCPHRWVSSVSCETDRPIATWKYAICGEQGCVLEQRVVHYRVSDTDPTKI
ncbi:hypothetical protein NPIL_228551 [Nephila pilipes]|uniref:Secreted protein n=1 Tax=Nephila pilipes TaxID=299642 RepID=A0A8X6PLY9_NEPPI|nr:hypothetical protein NPIL_228551 [Nephila pilipes]